MTDSQIRKLFAKVSDLAEQNKRILDGMSNMGELVRQTVDTANHNHECIHTLKRVVDRLGIKDDVLAEAIDEVGDTTRNRQDRIDARVKQLEAAKAEGVEEGMQAGQKKGRNKTLIATALPVVAGIFQILKWLAEVWPQ